VGYYNGADGITHAFLATKAPGGSAVAGPGLSSNVPSGAVFGESSGSSAGVGGGVIATNFAGSKDDGIRNAASQTLTIDDTPVNNYAALFGADLYNLGALTLDDGTVGVIGRRDRP
jgi:hypothetical protein